jgi:glycogen synthase
MPSIDAKQMKILMLGWELPPLYAGGIGMVCYDLLKELSKQNVDVVYMMPFGPTTISSDTRAKIITAESRLPSIKATIHKIPTLFTAYDSPASYEKTVTTFEKGYDTKEWVKKPLYGKNLFEEVDLFAKRVYELIDDEHFDVIHAHDWMTFPAAIGAADKKQKPLIVHVHNTIFDRYLGNASSHERDIEYAGLIRASKIIAVSQYVKNTIVAQYNIDEAKIEVIHNAPNSLIRQSKSSQKNIEVPGKMVLFTGRITIQKGPEYFLHCAKKVLEKEPQTTFVMAGSGDMFEKMVQLSAELGIGKNMLFTGFYNMDEAKALYERADCYIMPSVSEPFGIVPFEAMDHRTPTIISKSSGCSEILSHALKVDFWDTHEMANKVISVLRYPPLSKSLAENGRNEVSVLNWEKPATQCIELYERLRG